MSDKEKAAYSLEAAERQRRRQETDFDAEAGKDVRGEFSKKFEDFKSSQPPEEKPKTRDDFETPTT